MTDFDALSRSSSLPLRQDARARRSEPRSPWATLVLSAGLFAGGGDDPLVDLLHDPAAEHADQLAFLALVGAGKAGEAFELAFETGDELFETRFNALDGVGAHVGNGQRFTRVPRADMNGPGQWATHVPARTTGPNAESCNACHDRPTDDGAGMAAANVHRDPEHRGFLGKFIQRNTPHLFAAGAVQRTAEEMTVALHAVRAAALADAVSSGHPVTRKLVAKGVEFGSLTASPGGLVDTSTVDGVDDDLVVRPFQWKGSVPNLRDFNRGAGHNELGMQGIELVGAGVDGDDDHVVDELTVGDLTALSVYLAAQPRPTSKLELSALGLLETPLTSAERQEIRHGRLVLHEVGCSECHVPFLRLSDAHFQEPSSIEDYRDALFPAGQDPLALGLDPAFAIAFDLTADQPDNQIERPDGSIVHMGSLRVDGHGRALVELFGDLKRHDMGRELAESIDEVGTGASVFLTENLWGVGSSAPYLHDGRATTLTEAILAHGGEARGAREAFRALPAASQAALIAFLDNLVLFKAPEGAALRVAADAVLEDLPEGVDSE